MPTQPREQVAFGRAIRVHRARQSLSQESLAERAGMDRSYLGDIERGERNVGLLQIWQIAGAFGLSASELLADAEAEAERLNP